MSMYLSKTGNIQKWACWVNQSGIFRSTWIRSCPLVKTLWSDLSAVPVRVAPELLGL